jgi:succinoglycan biosynthesis transport protein ExoP
VPEYGGSPRTEIITYPKQPRSATAVPRVLYLEPLNNENSWEQTEQSASFDAWGIILKRLPVIVAMLVVGTIVGFAISVCETPLYQSKVSLEIQNPNDAPINLPMADLQAESSPESYLPTQSMILQSRTLHERALAKLSSGKFESGIPVRQGLLAHLLRSKTSSARTNGLPPIEVKVDIENNTRIVNVVCDSPDPRMAASYANTLADVYIDSNLQARWDAINRARQWLAQQLDEARGKLDDSENKLSEYGRASDLMFIGDKESAAQDKLKEIQAALSDAQAIRIEKQSVYQIAAATPADAVPQVQDNVRLNQYQAQIADLRRELAELSSQYTPEHPKVQKVQAQINQLETSFGAERQNILTRIRSEYQAALMRENLLNGSFRQQSALVSEQSQKSITYNILERDVETNRQLYDSLLQKSKEADVATAMRGSNVRIVDMAQAPPLPYKPNVGWYTLSGSLSGLGLGMVLIMVQEGLDRTFKGPGDSSIHLKLPELGVIPSGKLEAAKNLDGFSAAMRLPRANATATAVSRDVELISWRNKSSNIAESFRGTLASILQSSDNCVAPRVMLVSSASRGEGKTTVVSNLGIALAEINQRVLLVDGDMRKPRLGEVFNIENDWGLGDLLREKSSLRDSPVEALVRPTYIPNLSILTSGRNSAGATNLLYSSRMVELLQRLRCDFDHILIDSPPMLLIADARILGRLVDGVILVCRAGKTHRDSAFTAKQRLTRDGIPVLGTILNGWDVKGSSRYSYDYEYYQSEK